LALTGSESISLSASFQSPRDFFVKKFSWPIHMAAEVAAGVEFPQSDQRRVENDGAG
jgi:hypothetical protein